MVVATTFPARPGDGTPEFVLTLARSIPDHDVTVVAPRMPGAARSEVIDGVRVRRVAYFPRRWEGLAAEAIMPTLRARPWRAVEVPFLVGALLLATWREVRRQEVAVLNPHWIVPAGLVALAVRAVTGMPYVVTVHGADAYTLRGRLGRMVKRLVLRRAAGVLPVSGDIARSLDLRGAPVLRMGVDTAAIRAAVGDRAPEDGLLLYIGRLVDKKGVDVLVEALARLDGARLEVVGDGPDRAALHQLAARLGVSDRVRFRGKLPKAAVIAALARAQIAVIPSRVGAGGDMEGTPVVLCEVMAAGVPVVASNLGGLGECIDDGLDGLLVPPGDVDALATTLDKALNGGVDLAALGRAAAATARRNLDISAVGAEYARVFAAAATPAAPTPTGGDASPG
ncbi:MAG TPA: glycosyltransferase [Acidimicrobiales bacterium]|nr:glycosyltransferase [Acidimicrobiales bacterium]